MTGGPPRIVTRAEFDAGKRAMSSSRAWPAVFKGGSAEILLSAALAAMGIEVETEADVLVGLLEKARAR